MMTLKLQIFRLPRIYMQRILLSLGLGLGIVSCSASPSSAPSKTAAVSIPLTEVKWQSIGNCWAYGALGWAEAVVLAETGLRTNFSESYLTYRHFEEQILAGTVDIQTGGSFLKSRNLIARYGLMYEGDFIPNEATVAKSSVQESALEYLKTSLATGVLATDRSKEAVRSELDKAFGVDFSKVQSKIFQANTVKVGSSTLWDRMAKMNYVNYPNRKMDEVDLPYFTETYPASELAIQRRVMKALIDKQPIVVNWFVDFNGLSKDGIFSTDGLEPGRQGYHSVVVSDFTAEYVDDGGTTWTLPEGPMAPEFLEKALERGHITSLIVKNSWGGAERPDRPSYVNYRGESGYAKILDNYAFGWMKELKSAAEDAENADNAAPAEFKGSVRGVQSFVLPEGY
jgi:hypothetical protein